MVFSKNARKTKKLKGKQQKIDALALDGHNEHFNLKCKQLLSMIKFNQLKYELKYKKKSTVVRIQRVVDDQNPTFVTTATIMITVLHTKHYPEDSREAKPVHKMSSILDK